MINDSVLNIEDMIYEIRGKQVMLDSEVVVIKLHDYHYNMIYNKHDIDKSISMCKCFL